MTETKAKWAFVDNPAIHLGLIFLLGAVAYSNTLSVPFQWDEQRFLIENPVVKDFSYFVNPSKAEGLGTQYYSFRNRYVSYLTFALNYKLHGLDVLGYHVVNISLHILNAFLVYSLAVLIFRTPFMRGSSLAARPGPIALFAGLLFISHPIQTEAVTYIMQRWALLVAFFYLGSIALYLNWRGSRIPFYKGHPGLYILSLLSAVLAMKSKENAFTLPVVLMFVEFFFFEGRAKKRLLYLSPFLLTLLIVPLTQLGIGKPLREIFEGAGAAAAYHSDIPRAGYFFTQLWVVARYIKLLFMPVGQNFDYGYFLIGSFFDHRAVLSFLFISIILIVAAYLRFSKGDPVRRLLSFGVFFFFIALSVESSLFPINTIMCEYRVYLPSAGMFIAVSSFVFFALDKTRGLALKRALLLLIFVLPVVLASVSYLRNGVWGTKISLWEDAVKKAPENARGHYNLANAYGKEGQKAKAMEHYIETVRLKPDHIKARNNIGIILFSEGRTDEAIVHFSTAIELNPDNGSARLNLGLAYFKKGMIKEAGDEMQKILDVNPKNAEALRFLEYIRKRTADGQVK